MRAKQSMLKRKARRASVFAMAALTLLGSPGDEVPAILPRKASVVNKSALVRAGAAMDSDEVGELLQGAAIDVLERRVS